MKGSELLELHVLALKSAVLHGFTHLKSWTALLKTGQVPHLYF